MHPAGGEIFCYRELADRLAPTDRVFGVASLQSDANAHWTIPQLATAYVEAIREAKIPGPYQFLGWSFGGAIAFEVALQFSRGNSDAAQVTLLDTHASSCGDALMPTEDQLLRSYWDEIRRAAGIGPMALEWTAPEDRWAAMARQLHSLRPRGTALGPFALERSFAVYRMHLAALTEYRPGQYDGPLLVFRALHGDGIDREDRALGWRKHATGEIRCVDLPTDHYGVLGSAHIATIIDNLRSPS